MFAKTCKNISRACMVLVLVAANIYMLPAQEIEVNLRTSSMGTQRESGQANFELAARFAPYRISELVHSTSVDPHWIKDSEKFWYEWEDTEGKRYHLVDPIAGTKTQIFDNDWIAAELTKITKDPWDAVSYTHLRAHET